MTQKIKNLIFLLILLVVAVLAGAEIWWWNNQPLISSPWAEVGTKPNNQERLNFVSKDGRLKFSYRSDWICKEVVNNFRVDCYPESRKGEEYDAGLDVNIVYGSNITIWINNCEATGEKPKHSPDAPPSNRFIKIYNNCRVLVTAEQKINEGEFDEIIFSNSL